MMRFERLDRLPSVGVFCGLVRAYLPDVDKQSIVRLDLDTLYSFGVFDLTTPVTITLPDSGELVE